MMPFRLMAVLALLAQAAQQAPRPTFQGGTEVIMVDVQVSNNKWQPLEGLSKEQFEVLIDGRRRNIVTSEFVRIAGGDAAPAPAGGTSRFTQVAGQTADLPAGRTLILGVDQSSLQIVNEAAAREAVTRVLDMAAPGDLIGLVAYPQPGVSIAPTRDRAAIREVLRQIGGQFFPVMSRYNVSLSEASDFVAKDQQTTAKVLERECGGARGIDPYCRRELELLVNDLVITSEMQAVRSINGLHSVVEAVREWPGRKTLVVISAGIATSDRLGGRPDVRLEADSLGQRAARANAVIYTLHLDVAFLTAFSAQNRGRGVQTVSRDSFLAANGLERFTGMAGGSLITVHAGPDQAIRRLMQETSAYYMLGVEAEASDRDDKVHRIQVKVNQRGATVRSRTSVFIPKAQ